MQVPTKFSTSQHESKLVWHESTQIKTSVSRVNTSQLDQEM